MQILRIFIATQSIFYTDVAAQIPGSELHIVRVILGPRFDRFVKKRRTRIESGADSGSLSGRPAARPPALGRLVHLLNLGRAERQSNLLGGVLR